MTTNTQLKKAFAAVMPLAVKEEFVAIRTSYLCFARQRGPFVDRLSIWVSRHGEFADAAAMIWSPYLTMTSGFSGDLLDVEHMSPLVGGNLSARSVRESWMWDVRPEALEATARQLASAVEAVAVPWFDSVNSGEALVRECALNPDYWRRVARSDREAIAHEVDSVLSGERTVPQFRLLDQKSAERMQVPVQLDAPASHEGAYEQVTMPYKSKSTPSLKGAVTFLRKKR
ncbi:MAG: hypothetical protein HY854_19780 [Burkholderiales bacterium]|nr:hypothetical protein [Burkholderiales bacterium]